MGKFLGFQNLGGGAVAPLPPLRPGLGHCTVKSPVVLFWLKTCVNYFLQLDFNILLQFAPIYNLQIDFFADTGVNLRGLSNHVTSGVVAVVILLYKLFRALTQGRI